MLNTRIVSAIGIAAIASVLMAGGATAQIAGPPLALLAGLNPPHEHRTHQARTVAHPKIASRTNKRVAAGKLTRHTRLASRKHHPILAAQPVDPPARTTAAALPENALPENAWPSQPTASSQATPSDAAPPADNVASAPEAVAADNQTTPSAVVVGGQTVDVATPDQANAIDLAADDHHDLDQRDLDQRDLDHHDLAVADDRTTKPEPPAQRVLAAPVHKDGSPVGSASWIAQVLAAFGGAVAAGVVAWFLIGGGPQRMYG
jgi:hypothetical protein